MVPCPDRKTKKNVRRGQRNNPPSGSKEKAYSLAAAYAGNPQVVPNGRLMATGTFRLLTSQESKGARWRRLGAGTVFESERARFGHNTGHKRRTVEGSGQTQPERVKQPTRSGPLLREQENSSSAAARSPAISNCCSSTTKARRGRGRRGRVRSSATFFLARALGSAVRRRRAREPPSGAWFFGWRGAPFVPANFPSR